MRSQRTVQFATLFMAIMVIIAFFGVKRSGTTLKRACDAIEKMTVTNMKTSAELRHTNSIKGITGDPQ
jgi:hypothetical protein